MSASAKTTRSVACGEHAGAHRRALPAVGHRRARAAPAAIAGRPRRASGPHSDELRRRIGAAVIHDQDPVPAARPRRAPVAAQRAVPAEVAEQLVEGGPEPCLLVKGRQDDRDLSDFAGMWAHAPAH